MFKEIHHNLNNFLIGLNIDEKYAFWLKNLIIIVGIIIFSVIVNYVAKIIISKVVTRIAKKSKNTWDDVLLKYHVFTKLSHFAPAMIIYFLAPFALYDMGLFYVFIQTFAKVYMVFVFIMAFNAFLKAINDIYETYPIAKEKPIRGYLQILKIIIYFVCAIIILSFILQRSPMFFLGGLGALTAVLMLVFKDTILGFVASIQLATNNMLHIGDWITMSQHGADGIVVEMNISTVKVQNFDKTITMIPTYLLIAESFQNWRGMEQSGVRRMKRSFKIDINSVKTLDLELIKKIENFNLTKEFCKPFIKKMDNANFILSENGNIMTNLTLFRLYFEQLIKNNPNIDKNNSLIIRNLDPDDKGIPIEMYAFSKIQEWAKLETMQSEILEHIYIVLPVFDLRLFQLASGFEVSAKK